jgi:hypothetical protein
MLVLRCTRKLLDRVGPPVANPPQSTTVLGEWYAKPFAVAQRRFILLVNASTRIAVVMYARDVAHLPDHFPEALAPVLAQLGIPADDIVREVEASRTVVVATTDSRSLLGQLNDYALHIQFLGEPYAGLAARDAVSGGRCQRTIRIGSASPCAVLTSASTWRAEGSCTMHWGWRAG